MARKVTKDDLDKYLEHGIDVPGRTILVMDDIYDHIAQDVVRGLQILDRSEGDITIRLCTDGGEWYSGMAIYDAITECKNPVRVIGMGKVMSMGAIIIQAADERILLPNTTTLVHYGSEWFGGHTKNLERHAKESKRASTIMEDILLERIREKKPKFSRADFKRKFAFDVYMSAQEAIDFGLADRIA